MYQAIWKYIDILMAKINVLNNAQWSKISVEDNVNCHSTTRSFPDRWWINMFSYNVTDLINIMHGIIDCAHEFFELKIMQGVNGLKQQPT